MLVQDNASLVSIRVPRQPVADVLDVPTLEVLLLALDDEVPELVPLATGLADFDFDSHVSCLSLLICGGKIVY